VRAPQNDVLVVADEDHSALRIVPIPFAEDTKVTTVSLPGRPAQVIASRDRVLVTVRDLPEGGGGLVILKRDGSLGLNETTRVALPADAWGLALAPDESFVVVSSAWSGRVSVVDLTTAKVRATVEVGREPRGVAILPDGKRAYVSHLVGTAITRIDSVDSATPSATRLDLPASPLRAAAGTKPGASLGYSVVASPNGDRLFFPRQLRDSIHRRCRRCVCAQRPEQVGAVGLAKGDKTEGLPRARAEKEEMSVSPRRVLLLVVEPVSARRQDRPDRARPCIA
jgi:YVTN family beta-propeller protein